MSFAELSFAVERNVKFMPNSVSSRCQLCFRPFGFTKKRHHCKRWYVPFKYSYRSGFLVCDECSLKRARRVEDNEMVRICDHCCFELTNNSKSHDQMLSEMAVGGIQQKSSFILSDVMEGRGKLSGSFREGVGGYENELHCEGYLRRRSDGLFYLRFVVPTRRGVLKLILSSLKPGDMVLQAEFGWTEPSSVSESSSNLSVIDQIGYLDFFSFSFPQIIIEGSAAFKIPYIPTDD